MFRTVPSRFEMGYNDPAAQMAPILVQAAGSVGDFLGPRRDETAVILASLQNSMQWFPPIRLFERFLDLRRLFVWLNGWECGTTPPP